MSAVPCQLGAGLLLPPFKRIMIKIITSSRLRAALFQALVMAVFSAAAALLPLICPPLKLPVQWIILPALSALTAGLFAFSGVTCYLAWLMPPLIVSALPWLIIGYPLSPGIMLLCALLAMIGASSGDVLYKRRA